MRRNKNQGTRKTSWNHVAGWYKRTVGEKGSFFHTNLIFPKLTKLLRLSAKDSLLDLGCGQGVLARNIPQIKNYTGIDISSSLISYAEENTPQGYCHFFVGDAGKPLDSMDIDPESFDYATIILALQNIESMPSVFHNAARFLKKGGKFYMVINHPIFRIPKLTAWGNDYDNEIQYRRIDRYLTPQKIAIDMHPGNRNESLITTSFHYPLSYYTEKLSKAGFMIELIEEWISPKKSEGRYAVMENRARNEFPMFMCIVAVKQ